MSILSVSVGISHRLIASRLYAKKGGGLSEPTLYVSSEFTAPDKMRNKRRPKANFLLSEQAFFLG